MSNLTNNTVSLQSILDTVNTLPDAAGGIELPELTNEGVADDLVTGKELINSKGKVVTGTMPNNGTISSTMDGINTKSVNIPLGYTSGGTVSLTDDIDNEVDAQADLIAQIKNTVDSLPEADGGGSGNTSLNTCTVTLNINAGTIIAISATSYIDGEFSAYSHNRDGGQSCTVENVLCESAICVVLSIMYIEPQADYTGTAEIYSRYSFGSNTVYVIKAPTVSGESCTITMYDDD